MKKENNRLRAANKIQYQKSAYMAAPKKTLISCSRRKVYAEKQTQQERIERKHQSNIWRNNGWEISKIDERHDSTYSRNLVNLKQDKKKTKNPYLETPESNFWKPKI